MKRSPWFEMKAKGGKAAEVLIYDEINPFYGVGAKEFAQELKALGEIAELIVRINSPGGSVFDGVAIYNILKEQKAHVHVQIDGMALSIASVIALSGNTIAIAENAFMMIHNPWTLAVGDADELRKLAGTLDKLKESLVDTYAGHTGLPTSEIQQMMDEETWFRGAEAIEKGFAHELSSPVKIAASFDPSRFKNTPAGLLNPLETAAESEPHNPVAVEGEQSAPAANHWRLEIAKRLNSLL